MKNFFEKFKNVILYKCFLNFIKLKKYLTEHFEMNQTNNIFSGEQIWSFRLNLIIEISIIRNF